MVWHCNLMYTAMRTELCFVKIQVLNALNAKDKSVCVGDDTN